MKLQKTLFLTIILSLIYSSITFGAIVEGSKDTGLWVSLTNNEFDYVANHYQDELNSDKDESIVWVTEGGKMYPKSMVNGFRIWKITIGGQTGYYYFDSDGWVLTKERAQADPNLQWLIDAGAFAYGTSSNGMVNGSNGKAVDAKGVNGEDVYKESTNKENMMKQSIEAVNKIYANTSYDQNNSQVVIPCINSSFKSRADCSGFASAVQRYYSFISGETLPVGYLSNTTPYSANFTEKGTFLTQHSLINSEGDVEYLKPGDTIAINSNEMKAHFPENKSIKTGEYYGHVLVYYGKNGNNIIFYEKNGANTSGKKEVNLNQVLRGIEYTNFKGLRIPKSTYTDFNSGHTIIYPHIGRTFND